MKILLKKAGQLATHAKRLTIMSKEDVRTLNFPSKMIDLILVINQLCYPN